MKRLGKANTPQYRQDAPQTQSIAAVMIERFACSPEPISASQCVTTSAARLRQRCAVVFLQARWAS